MVMIFQGLVILTNRGTLVHSKFVFKIVFMSNLYLNLLVSIIFIALKIHEINKKNLKNHHENFSNTLYLFSKYSFLYLKIAGLYFWMARLTIKGFRIPLMSLLVSELILIFSLMVVDCFSAPNINSIQQ